MMGFKYLQKDIQQAFECHEYLITRGYSSYLEIYKIIINGSYRDQIAPAPNDKLLEMRKLVNTWVNECIKVLKEIYVSSNYANEFMLTNHARSIATTTGEISDIKQDLIGYIRKLEDYRNNLLNKSNLTINNLGYLNIQIGNNNTNEQTE